MKYFFLLLGALVLLSCRPAPAISSGGTIKIYVSEAGFYRVPRRAVASAGLPVDPTRLDGLSLTHRGQPVPLEIQSKADNFELVFYAPAPDNPYSAQDVYWLANGGGEGARIKTRTVSPGGGQGPISFIATLKVEENKIYLPEGIEGTHWFWKSLNAGDTQMLTATLDALAPGEGQIEITLGGQTTGAHRVEVEVNGQAAGEAKWEGQTLETWKSRAANLREGENEVTLRLPKQEDSIDIVMLDSAVITYPRAFLATQDSLEWSGAGEMHVQGFRGSDVSVYDITDSNAPERLSGVSLAAQSETAALAFDGGTEERRYLAIRPGAYKTPDRVVAAEPNNLRNADQQADYIVIAPQQFAATLEPLVKHRTGQGLTVKVVDVEQVYDAFADGVADPRALRAFIQYARDKWKAPAPRFVLLAGKATYDYRNYLNAPNRNLVPTLLIDTPHLGEAASDNRFVTENEDSSRPELAIGRIPAKTPQELKIAIDKLLAFEAAKADSAWRQRALFVADDKEPGFDVSSDSLIEDLPENIKPKKIYLSAFGGKREAARAELLKQWNEGALLTAYIGHGSIDTWSAGPLFSSKYVGELKNGDRLPILLTPTCLDGYFYHPEKDSLTEALLFRQEGGIVAGLVPTGTSVPEAQDRLMKELFAQLFVERVPTFGEAVMRAKQNVKDDSNDVREVLDTFVLIGDPAMKWGE